MIVKGRDWSVGCVRLVSSVVILSLCLVLLNFMRPPSLDINTSDSYLDYSKCKWVEQQCFLGGYGSFIGIYPWITAVSNYASVIFDGDSGKLLPSRLRFASGFDTLWYYPTLFASLIIPELPGYTTADAVPFLEEGVVRFPEKWQFRLIWAQYILDSGHDSVDVIDSAVKILLPLSTGRGKIPQYARNLGFTLLHKTGKPDEAMGILIETYERIPDPLIRMQFQKKVADLLVRNRVSFGGDSASFMNGISSMLNSGESNQVAAAKMLLIRLTQNGRRDSALIDAHRIAHQFQAFQAGQVGLFGSDK